MCAQTQGRVGQARVRLGWTAVNCSRVGPSHGWTLGGAVAVKVLG